MTRAADHGRADTGVPAVVLVDGEHHPSAVRAALAGLAARHLRPVAAVYVGGTEKIDRPGEPPDLGVFTTWPADAVRALGGLLAETDAEVVVDLAGPPALDERRRQRAVAVALHAGCRYEAPGVRYDPPARPRLTTRPTIGVVAVGKRTGKTAITGALVRHLTGRGRRPVVLAMGRGGPPEPVVVSTDRRLEVADLLAIVDRGGHAASDLYENALTTAVPAVGCHRVGEGPTGAVGHHNLDAAAAAAEELDGDVTVVDSSGAALPPCALDACALVVPATVDPDRLGDGVPLRWLLADLVVVTLADLVDRSRVTRVITAVGDLLAEVGRDPGSPPEEGGWAAPPVVLTAFQPVPLAELATGSRVLLATTAPRHTGRRLVRQLTELTGVEVVGVTHALSDRHQLREELADAPAYEVLVSELKAAAVDVALRAAGDRGARTVFYDNRPRVLTPGLAPTGLTHRDDLATAFDLLVARADRAGNRRQAVPTRR